MQHKIVTFVCALAIIALIAVGVSARHSEAVKQFTASAKAHALQYRHDQEQKAAVAIENKRVNDQCHMGQASYDAQTTAYKKLHPNRPVCDLQVVE